MTRAEKYAQWIVANRDKKGTPEFEKVAEAYRQAKEQESTGRSGKTYRGLNVVKEMGDGGIVLRAPDGGLTYVNEQAGYSTSDPQKIEEMMGGTKLREQLTTSFDEQTLEQAPVSSRALKVAEGLPFIGSYIANANDKTKLAKGAMDRQNPLESAGLELAGGVLGSVPLAMAAPAAPAALAGGGLKAGAGLLGLSSAGGALEGAIYGAGEGDALGGAITGAVGGAAGGLVGTMFGKAYNVFKQSKADRNAYKKIGELLGISDDAAKVIARVWGEGDTDPASAVAAIRRAGDRGMLADADVAAANLLDATKAAGNDAMNIAGREVGGRVGKQSRDVMKSLDQGLGKTPIAANGLTMDMDTMVQSIYAGTKDQRETAYNKALNTIIDYSSPEGKRIEQIFNDVIPERFTKNAYAKTAERLRINESADFRQFLAAIKEDGTVDITRLPDMRSLDELKKSIGELAFEKNEFGQYTADAKALQPAYFKLRDAIGNAVPDYKKATALGADTIAQREALATGMDAFKRKTTPIQLAGEIKNMGAVERDAVRKGARIALDDTMSQVKKSIAGLNAEHTPDQVVNSIEEVAKLWKDLSSRDSKNKIQILMGRDNADIFYREMEKLQVAFALKAALAVNSKTATRLMTNETIEEITKVGPLGSVLRGEPATATKKILQEVTGMTDEAMDSRKQDILKDVARGLTKMKGGEARAAANTILKIVGNKRVSDAELQGAYSAIISSTPMLSTGMATQTGELVLPEL